MRFIITLVLMAVGVAASAQQTALRLSLKECIDMALANNLSYKSAEASVSQSQLMEGTSFDVPQTMVSLVQTATDGGGPDNGLKFSQEFDFPTVYAAKHKYLKSETELEKRKAEMTRNDIVREVWSLYYSLIYSREVKTIVAAQDTLYERFCQVAKARYEAGETSRLEWLNARRLWNENRLALEKALVDYAAIGLRFQTALNTDRTVEPIEERLLPIEGYIPEDTVDFSLTPEGMVADGRLKVAKRNQSLAKQGFMPTLSVGATTQLLIKGFNPYHIDRPRFEKGDFVGFEVGVGVPLFFGSQRAKARAANKAMEAEELRMAEDKNKQTAEYQILSDDYCAARNAVEYYQNTGMPEAEEMVRLSLVSYELGEIGYEEHARNLENALAVKKAHSEALEQYNQTIIKLKHIKGEL